MFLNVLKCELKFNTRFYNHLKIRTCHLDFNVSKDAADFFNNYVKL
jgi:hypothetical protein